MAIFMAIAPAASLFPPPAAGFPDFGHVNEKDKRKQALGRGVGKEGAFRHLEHGP